MGNEIQYNGELKIANDLKISYVSQSTEDLKGNLKDFAQQNKIKGGLNKCKTILSLIY